jgi:hypothetical protein
MQRSRRFLVFTGTSIVLLALAAVGMFGWVYLYNPCDPDDVGDATAFLVTQTNRYDDVYASAASGTRTSLTYPITVLQQMLVDTQSVSVPACMQTAKSELLSYMGTVIFAFQSYTAGEEDTKIRNLVQQSNAHYDNFYSELERISECAPVCFP